MIGIDVGEKEKLSKECGAEVKKTPKVSFHDSHFLTLFESRYSSTSQNSAGTKKGRRSLQQKLRKPQVAQVLLLWSFVQLAMLRMGKVLIS
jgi:hypothetical protein